MKKDKIEKKESGLKEFFKLTKWKIIIFFILLGITFIVVMSISGVSCDFKGCKNLGLTILLYKFLFIIEYSLFERILPDFILLVVQIAYLYILTCLIHLIVIKTKRVLKNKL